MFEVFASRVSAEKLVTLWEDEMRNEWLVTITAEDEMQKIVPQDQSEAFEAYTHPFCGRFSLQATNYHEMVDKVAVPTV